jgi:hypothetical protein
MSQSMIPRKLFLHVGYAKCGSTSLQAALSKAPNIIFPSSGNHGGEHLALALTLRGIDDWTRKFFDETWVEPGYAGMMEEIKNSTETVVLSSERLSAMSPVEIETFSTLFPDFEVHVLILQRDTESYIKSIWRHAVFRHDYAEPYDVLLKKFHTFQFGDVREKFSRYFPVHEFNIDNSTYEEEVGALIGTMLEIPHVNSGVPMEFAALLSQMHRLLGTEAFRTQFNTASKQHMLKVWRGQENVEIEKMTVPLF